MPILRTFVFKKNPPRPHISMFRLWCCCIMDLFLLFTPQPSCGLNIFSSSVSPTYAAVGESVILTCLFTLAPEDVGLLDIEWIIKPADISQDETVVIWYAGNRIYDNFHPFRRRVQFVSRNPASGNASIRILDLKMTDTNTYHCKVKKLPGMRNSIIHLNVMKKPSNPECSVEGVVELDRKVVLRCRDTEGSPPIWYRWAINGTDKRLPYDSTVDSTQGDLFLTITKEVAPGTLVCTAENHVGTKSCLVALRLKNSAGVAITAAVVGPVVFIAIIAIIVFCYKRGKVENSGNEIFEDELPPRKRLSQKSYQVVHSRTASCAKQEVKIKAQGNQKEKNLETDSLYVEMNDLYIDMGSTHREPGRRTAS